MKNLLLIINPLAGKGKIQAKALEIIDNFVKNDYQVTVRTTQSPEDAYETVCAQGHLYDMLVVSGGDGTLSQTIAAMMTLDPKPILGYIPAGTTNDFATSLKIPKDPVTAGLNAINGVPTTCDIGKLNQKYFDYVAAFGIITQVTYETPQNIKNALGYLAYILEAVKSVHGLQSYTLNIECDGQIIEGDFIFGMITNSDFIGGIKNPLSKLSTLNDGIFEVILIRKPHNIVDIQQIINSTLQKNLDSGAMITMQAKEIRISCQEEIPWNLDGEYGGSYQEVVIANLHKAITIMTPKSDNPEFLLTE